MVDQNKIKNVVLDLGGVLVDIDPQQTLDAMMKLIDPKTSLKPDWAELNNVVHAMEVSIWWQEEFILKMKQVCKLNVTESKIIIYNFGKFYPEDAYCEIKTLEGVMTAKTGDYIIKGVDGEIYPCKPDIFKKTYEVIE